MRIVGLETVKRLEKPFLFLGSKPDFFENSSAR